MVVGSRGWESVTGIYGWRRDGWTGDVSCLVWGGPGSRCSGECGLLKWKACLCRAVLETAPWNWAVLVGEDRRGKVPLQHVCSGSWADSCLVGGLLVGSSRESSKKVLVCTFPQPAVVRHPAAPALLFTHPAQLTGTIDHGYGWGCQGLPCILGTFGQDLIAVSGTLPSLACQPCFLFCRADNASLGFVAKELAGCLGCMCRS